MISPKFLPCVCDDKPHDNCEMVRMFPDEIAIGEASANHAGFNGMVIPFLLCDECEARGCKKQ